MDCKPSNNSNKKLVQARLPFKRLNPEPKDDQSPKRPCAHTCPDAELLERENENESSPLPLRTGPPLVNGKGPLDGFLSRKRSVSPDENMIVDLSVENASPVKSILSSNGKQQKKDRLLSSGKLKSIVNAPKTQTVDSIPVDDDDENDLTCEDEHKLQTSTSVHDTTQESECEAETQNESQNVSSLANASLLSNSPDSSMSETSPEKSKTEDLTPASTPTQQNTTPKNPAEKKEKRHSLKDEKLRLRQEKERLREEAKVAKEKKKEDARRQKEERDREKREKKERDERERKEKKEREEQERKEKKEKEEKEKAERLKAKEEQRKSKLEYVHDLIFTERIKPYVVLNTSLVFTVMFQS